jgi:hypothetical protein
LGFFTTSCDVLTEEVSIGEMRRHKKVTEGKRGEEKGREREEVLVLSHMHANIVSPESEQETEEK